MSKKYFSTAWLVWLFPVFSIIITGSLYSQYLKHRGPLIHIYFNDATGIEVEKTVLRFRGVNVGKVEEILLSENDKGVSIVARLDREAKHLAVDGTQFWIVQPQVDFQGVRGLETLFRGSYIRILQGQGSGDAATEFKGHSETDESNSVVYYLRSPIVDSINPGDFIFYRGLKIGNVSEVSLAHTGQWIDIQIQIEKKIRESHSYEYSLLAKIWSRGEARIVWFKSKNRTFGIFDSRRD